IALARMAEVPPIEELRPDVPPRFCHVVERALAHDPQDRFNSAEQMARIVSKLLLELPARIDDKALGRWTAGLVRYLESGAPPPFEDGTRL
ncbi:MAG: hypothetical protein AAGA56_29815, partial [Myxococcota bacterium]